MRAKRADPKPTGPSPTEPGPGKQGVVDPISKVAYLLLVPGAHYSDQPSLIQALAWLIWLNYHDVPAEHVLAFMPRELPGRPTVSAHVGLPPLRVPPRYRGCVREGPVGPQALATDLMQLAGRASVERVVMIYLDHGQPDKLRLPGGAPLRKDVLQAVLGVVQEKPMLVILDACYSGTFARAVLPGVSERPATVAFLTAAEETAYFSLVIVSGEETLVAPWPEGADVAAGYEGVTPGWVPGEEERELVLGYHLTGSMFMRRFLHTAFYTGMGLQTKGIKDVPGVLNMPDTRHVHGFGFHAECYCVPETFGDTGIDQFLPLGPVTADHVVLAEDDFGPELHFRDVVPAMPMGSLLDDVVDPRGFMGGYGVVEVALDPGKICLRGADVVLVPVAKRQDEILRPQQQRIYVVARSKLDTHFPDQARIKACSYEHLGPGPAETRKAGARLPLICLERVLWELVDDPLDIPRFPTRGDVEYHLAVAHFLKENRVLIRPEHGFCQAQLAGLCHELTDGGRTMQCQELLKPVLEEARRRFECAGTESSDSDVTPVSLWRLKQWFVKNNPSLILDTAPVPDDVRVKVKDLLMPRARLAVDLRPDLVDSLTRFCLKCNGWEDFEKKIDQAFRDVTVGRS